MGYSESPFPHRVFDDYLGAGLLADIAASWPAPDWPGWVSYDPRFEHKRASDLTTPLPRAAGLALYRLAADALGPLVGRPFAVPDLSLWGGGLHEVLPGAGGLGCHLDASVGPRLGLRRAWSAVLWVHPRWAPSWGGELVLHGPDRLPVALIEPRPGRLALFACSDASWHSVRPVRGMAPRRSLALFGYEEGPASPHERPRALFAPAPGEDDSEAALEARRGRAVAPGGPGG